MTYYIVGVSILLMLVVLALAQRGLRDSGSIVLPAEQAEVGDGTAGEGSEGLDVVKITPDTVPPTTRVWRTLPSGSWVSMRVRPPLTDTWDSDTPLPPLQKVSTVWRRSGMTTGRSGRYCRRSSSAPMWPSGC